MLKPDAPAEISAVLECPQSGETYYFIRNLEVKTRSYIKIMLASRLRRLPGPEEAFEPGEEVVIKMWKRKLWETATIDENPYGELAAMQLLSAVGDLHFNRLLDFAQDDKFIFMVIPYMPGGDLFEKVLARDEPMSEDEARPIMAQLMGHLAFMRDNGIAHRYVNHVGSSFGYRPDLRCCGFRRDVSLENVLMNASGTYCFIDLGMSVRMPTFRCGTSVFAQDNFQGGKPSYMSPEVALEAEHVDPYATDVWAMGVIMYILLTRSPIYARVGDSSFQMVCEGRLQELLDRYTDMGLLISLLARNMITRMLCLDPTLRLTLEQAMKHPWMQGMIGPR